MMTINVGLAMATLKPKKLFCFFAHLCSDSSCA